MTRVSLRELIARFFAPVMMAYRTRVKPMPFVQQLSGAECGAACLAMVMRYYGKNVRLEELRELTVSGRDGTDAQTLIETAAGYGLIGRAVSLDLDELVFLDRGAILHWEFQHFVVFDGIERNGVRLVDPAQGRWRVPMDQFRRSFTGVAILFEPGYGFQPGGRPGRPITTYLRQVCGEASFVAHIVVTSALLQVLGLAMPAVTRLTIDRVIPRQDYNLLVVVLAGVGVVVLFQGWTTVIRAYFVLYLKTRLDARMTLGFLEHLLHLPFDFFQRRSAGDLMVRLNSNATVREILTGSVLSAVLDGSLAVGYLALLMVLSLPLAVLSCLLAAMQVVLFLATRRRQRQLLAEGLQVQSRSQDYQVEMLTAVETLKALGAERRAIEHWSSLFSAELNVSLRRGALDAFVQAVTVVVRTGTAVALSVVGTLQVLQGRLTLGDMMALIAVANGFLAPLGSLLATASGLQLLGVYLERLDDVMETPTERDLAGGRAPACLRGALSLDHVSFRYGPVSPYVVEDVSIEIAHGQFVAIVGRSGSGKSTLARLLVGLYAPTQGRVLYDDQDVHGLDIQSLRRQVGIVTQQAHLFAGTIRRNIALSDPFLPLDAIVKAAQRAQIHEDIVAMPMGYDTALIDRGASLSGGQQQRVALARALVADPRVLVLDEATSQLDAATERSVQESLATLQCTRVVIAHRLSTIVRADRILVMDRGRIVEQGRHDELLERHNVYAALVAAQMAGTTP